MRDVEFRDGHIHRITLSGGLARKCAARFWSFCFFSHSHRMLTLSAVSLADFNELGKLACVSSINDATADIAAGNALRRCRDAPYQRCTVAGSPPVFQNTCKSIAQPLGSTQWATATADTAADAGSSAIGLCFNIYKQECNALITSCDTESLPLFKPPTAPDTLPSPSKACIAVILAFPISLFPSSPPVARACAR